MLITCKDGHTRARLAALALALGAACAGSAPDQPDAALSPSCQEARDHSDLDWIQDNVFTPSCAAFQACHQGQALSALGLSLEPGRSAESLINVPSQRFPDQTLVVPGDPRASYLMVVLGSYDGPLSSRGTMPPANPLLCAEKRQAIERWIQSLPPG
jgi:hypothetical protein